MGSYRPWKPVISRSEVAFYRGLSGPREVVLPVFDSAVLLAARLLSDRVVLGSEGELIPDDGPSVSVSGWSS